MLEALKVIIFGIVEGITEWLPISSTGHLILLEELLHLKQNQAFLDMFYVVIQLGAILAVVVMYFHKLNPFSPTKTEKQKMLTIQLWVKVIIGSIPAMLIGLPFNDFIEEKFNNSYVVAATLIIYGILFIVIENYQKDKQPKVEKTFSAYDTDGFDHRRISGIGADPRNIPFGSDDRGSASHRSIKRSCGGIYIFPCNSGDVRRKFFETD